MSITEKTLKKWRKEALIARDKAMKPEGDHISSLGEVIVYERILRLTQELMDQKLKEGR